MALVSVLFEILKRPTIWQVMAELNMFMAPLWIAVFLGVLVGWSWKPKWAITTNFNSSTAKEDSSNTEAAGLGLSSFSIPGFNSLRSQLPSCISWISNDGSSSLSPIPEIESSSMLQEKEKPVGLVEDDLEHLCKLVEEKDGGPSWTQMMERSTPNMSYKAWRRDPETGPPQYRSRTVYEDATPESLRDFFWDDEFRMKWDDMILHAETLEECPTTGAMVVKWVRKFPFFCSDREYVIGRRIWESGRSYYCVTKGVPRPNIPRHSKPRRVDLYYSSWFIRAVESRKGDGQLSACEVVLYHHEDMGIPWEIAKLGVRQGMWGAVKKIDSGFRSYQKYKEMCGTYLSRCAYMAQINTKVSTDYLRWLETNTTRRTNGGDSPLGVETSSSSSSGKPAPSARNSIPKLVVVGGAIAIACSLDRGLLTKALIFGVARRFAKVGNKS